MSDTGIKILIADDHAIVRRGLMQIISEVPGMLVVDEACNGFETLKKVNENNYDVILLDISMPGRSGLDILRSIKSKKPKLPVLMLSVHPEEQYAIRAIKAGASGYLTKESAPDELIAAIKKISKGGRYVSSSLAEKLLSELEPSDEKPSHKILSDREYQVMCMFAMGKTLKEIAEELSLSIQTISTYRARILEKMKMNTIAEVIRYAVKQGLVE
ncbi:MAG: response regulator transcription factor [Nitrospirae bacterium]|jgi:two-component system, NarL family, invasion response regulator UvrY|nr:response regulator transcription factor [Nitrospirota bacterium]